MAKRMYRRKKVCFYCTNSIEPNYKSVDIIRNSTTERGKILPRRVTGVCAKHQRSLAMAVKRARFLALLPFVSENMS